MGWKLCPATVSERFMYSGTAITAAMAVSLMVIEMMEAKAGSMRTMLWGRMIFLTACARDMPRATAARIWPGLTEVMPARTISATYAALWMSSAVSDAQHGSQVRPTGI